MENTGNFSRGSSFVLDIKPETYKVKKPGTSGGKVFLNILWVLTGGLISAIENFFMGIALCITLIGIPLGIQYFKITKLIFAPFGKRVALNFKKHPLFNILFGLFGGYESALVLTALAVVFRLTIILTPFAEQLEKFAKFNLAPFGSEIIKEHEYSTNKSDFLDYVDLFERVNLDPNREITTSDGERMGASAYIKRQMELNPPMVTKPYQGISALNRYPYFLVFGLCITIVVFLILKLAMSNLDSDMLDGHLLTTIIIITSCLSFALDIFKAFILLIYSTLMHGHKKAFGRLFDFYPATDDLGVPRKTALIKKQTYNCYPYIVLRMNPTYARKTMNRDPLE